MKVILEFNFDEPDLYDEFRFKQCFHGPDAFRAINEIRSVLRTQYKYDTIGHKHMQDFKNADEAVEALSDEIYKCLEELPDVEY